MKRLLIISLIVLGNVNSAYSGELGDNCGCGLGTLIFEGKDTLIIQIFAATFNAPSQVFGISSGTLGCEQPIEVVKKEQLNNFVAHNMDNLAKDVANGYGKYVETMANLLDVSATKKTILYAKLKTNFETIFSSEEETIHHGDLIDKILALYQAI